MTTVAEVEELRRKVAALNAELEVREREGVSVQLVRRFDSLGDAPTVYRVFRGGVPVGIVERRAYKSFAARPNGRKPRTFATLAAALEHAAGEK